MLEFFKELALYNRWANQRLYQSVAGLSSTLYRENRKAPFHSIHGTLNHLLVVDRLWLHRLTGKGTLPTKLDEILYDDFQSLKQARQAEDERVLWYLDSLSHSSLGKDFSYRDMDGEAQHQQLQLLLAHLFNHQTHHRGHVHLLVTQSGIEAPALDLVYFLQEKQMAQDCFTCTTK